MTTKLATLPTIDAILDAITDNEPGPSYVSLVRAVARYPCYRSQLVAFYTIWAIQTSIAGSAQEEAEQDTASLIARCSLS